MHPRKLFRRPSPAMVVALLALFVALGGVGYAATSLPAGSVGRAQIRNDAVNYQKIEPGSVGIARINPSTVQARVLNTCTSGHSAIVAINSHGQPTCQGVLPAEFDTTDANPVSIGSSATTVASEVLSGEPSYIVFAAPYIQVTGTAGVDQQVSVSCTIGASPLPGTGQTRTATFDLAADHETESGAIPLVLTQTSNSAQQTESVTCTQSLTGSGTGAGAAPTVKASTSINALQTGGNTTLPSAG